MLAFDLHVAEFAGLKDLAAILAFDVFGILIARDDAYSGVGAGRVHELWSPEWRNSGQIVPTADQIWNTFLMPRYVGALLFSLRLGSIRILSGGCKSDTFGRILGKGIHFR